MEVCFPGLDGQTNRLTVESVDSTVGELLNKIREQLHLEKNETIVITWGPHRLVSEQSIESFLDFVEDHPEADEKDWKMTIHVV